MSKCPNCGTTLSCGCQKRVAANGKQGCSKCINQLKTGNKTVPINTPKEQWPLSMV